MKILAGRYEIHEKIGEGGMAVVYKAKCRLLKRNVAIKMLKPEFTHNRNFSPRMTVGCGGVFCRTPTRALPSRPGAELRTATAPIRNAAPTQVRISLPAAPEEVNRAVAVT